MSDRPGNRSILATFFVLSATSWSPALADCDTAAPVLTGFTFTPSAINTSAAAQTVTCNMTLTDNLAGVSNPTCAFTSADTLYRQSCSLATPTTGTTLNGTWSCVITFPRYSQSGVWTASVMASDAVGNGTFPIDPSLLGFSSTLTVTSTPDVVAPALGVFSLSPGSVNVSATSQTVTCTMPLTDALSGVAFASCQLSAPDSDQFASCGAAAPSSGTRNSGTFSCVLTIPHFADAGTWTSQVVAVDLVGNVATLNPAPTLAVTSVPEDIVVPSPSGFDFNPKT